MASKATTTHEEILTWAKGHGFVPVQVLPTKHDSQPPQLAFAMPDEVGGDLDQLGWEDFFASFDVQNLALVYDAGFDGHPGSSFYELVHNRPKSTLGYALRQS